MLSPTWFLLIALGFVTPVFNTIYFGWKAGCGVGALIGLGVGLIIGISNYYGIRAAGKGLRRWVVRCKEQQRSMAWPNRFSGLLVSTVFVWVIVSGVFGGLITQSVVQMTIRANQ